MTHLRCVSLLRKKSLHGADGSRTRDSRLSSQEQKPKRRFLFPSFISNRMTASNLLFMAWFCQPCQIKGRCSTRLSYRPKRLGREIHNLFRQRFLILHHLIFCFRLQTKRVVLNPSRGRSAFFSIYCAVKALLTGPNARPLHHQGI